MTGSPPSGPSAAGPSKAVDAAPVVCSAAECRVGATWRVNWRNPRIHDASRVKVWLACDAHRGQLEAYLATRGFPVKVTPLGEPAATVGA